MPFAPWPQSSRKLLDPTGRLYMSVKHGNRRRGLVAPTPAVPTRRLANELAKCRAEGAEALKADFQADVGYGQVGAAQQLLRALDPPPHQVLVGGLAEGLLEAAGEVRG